MVRDRISEEYRRSMGLRREKDYEPIGISRIRDTIQSGIITALVGLAFFVGINCDYYRIGRQELREIEMSGGRNAALIAAENTLTSLTPIQKVILFGYARGLEDYLSNPSKARAPINSLLRTS